MPEAERRETLALLRESGADAEQQVRTAHCTHNCT
jgi:hypothetical protein